MKVYKSVKAQRNIFDTYDRLLAIWNIIMEERDIPTKYGATHVILCGNQDNPPLVLFHGVGDNSALMWLYNAHALAQYFRVIAIDTIGGPGKSCPNENYNKSFDSATWIDQVLESLSLDRVYIAGVSYGAYLAQYYGINRPERVEKIVCMAGTVPTDNFNPMKVMIKIFMPEALFPTKHNTIKLLRKLCGKNSSVFTENLIVLEHYNHLLKGFNNMAMRYHKLISFNAVQIDSIRDKCLYLVGEDDPFAKLGGKDVLLKHNMNVKFFHEVGHGINHEIADEINNTIIKYFFS